MREAVYEVPSDAAEEFSILSVSVQFGFGRSDIDYLA
jgi:hypothetical protein